MCDWADLFGGALWAALWDTPLFWGGAFWDAPLFLGDAIWDVIWNAFWDAFACFGDAQMGCTLWFWDSIWDADPHTLGCILGGPLAPSWDHPFWVVR